MESDKIEVLKKYISREYQKKKDSTVGYNISNPRENYYYLTRPLFLKYSKTRATLTKEDLLYLIAFAYSWMPTVPKVGYILDVKDRLKKAVLFVNKIKIGDIDMDYLDSYRDDFENLKGFTNNSYVGMSKVLHFINPELFCIYDSRIVKRLIKVTGATCANITFLKLCPILYSIKKELKISMQDIDLILWL